MHCHPRRRTWTSGHKGHALSSQAKDMDIRPQGPCTLISSQAKDMDIRPPGPCTVIPGEGHGHPATRAMHCHPRRRTWTSGHKGHALSSQAKDMDIRPQGPCTLISSQAKDMDIRPQGHKISFHDTFLISGKLKAAITIQHGPFLSRNHAS